MHTQTETVGRCPNNGHDANATHTGKMLVSVITSDDGRRVNEKNVQTKLKLPAMLRSHKMPGFHIGNAM